MATYLLSENESEGLLPDSAHACSCTLPSYIVTDCKGRLHAQSQMAEIACRSMEVASGIECAHLKFTLQ